MYTQRFTLDCSYPVWFTRRSLAPDNDVLVRALGRLEPTKRHRVLCVVDGGLHQAQPGVVASIEAYAAARAEAMELVTAPVVVPGGEMVKNSESATRQVLELLHAHRVDRHSYLLMIGGGAVLDMAGLAATLCHRGVRAVRMPTTTLAQNDAGIGVKNGINAYGAKNFLGTFAPPFAVINDFDFLESLSPRDRRAGIAEAIKVALIRDGEFFNWLCEHSRALAAFEPSVTAQMVERGATLHLRHIAEGGDPFEQGSARPLDYGHWAAHKLERMTEHVLRHGEAVAIGLALDTRYSVEIGLLDEASQLRVQQLLTELGLPTWDVALDQLDADGNPAVFGGLRDFQEHLGGPLTVTMLSRVGHGVDVHTIDEAAMQRALVYLKSQPRCA